MLVDLLVERVGLGSELRMSGEGRERGGMSDGYNE
jgi:hypothetical protein